MNRVVIVTLGAASVLAIPAVVVVACYAPCDYDGTCSSGGQDSGGECQSDKGCPAETSCRSYQCIGHKCIPTNVGAGMPAGDTGSSGDCKFLACDGDGGTKPVNATAGTSCTAGGGKVCDGQGACVECVTKNDCSGTELYCYYGKCFSCGDDMQNGDETGIDCGGEHCLHCDGDSCMMNSECVNQFCDPFGVCKRVLDGYGCNIDKQCMSGRCGVCGTMHCCLLSDGAQCTHDANCASGSCAYYNNAMKHCLLSYGAQCMSDNQCASSNCAASSTSSNTKTCQ
jgi:hypothetical protein